MVRYLLSGFWHKGIFGILQGKELSYHCLKERKWTVTTCSQILNEIYTTKPDSLKPYGTGTKTKIYISGTG